MDFAYVYIIVALLVAITVHEASHAWMAYNLGDATAKNLGRLSLNPIVHLDPVGTLMMFITVLAGFGIGWGKPVPVNPYNLRNGAKAGMAMVSFSGPLANLVTASFFALFLRLDVPLGPFLELVNYVVIINIVLAFFNLIPLPPLDGFKVLLGLLPYREAYALLRLERFGPGLLLLVILGGMYTGLSIFRYILYPLVNMSYSILVGLPGKWF